MKTRILQLGLLLVALVPVFPSCVSEEYDLNDLNGEMTFVASGLAFPLGSTQELKLSDLMDSLDMGFFNKDANGAYNMSQGGSISLSDALPAFFENSDLILEDLVYKKDNLYSASGIVLPPSLGDGDYTVPGGILQTKTIGTQVFEVELKMDLPDEIKSVNKLVLNKNAKVKVSLSLKNPFISKGSLVPSIDVDLSDFLEIGGKSEPISLSDLVLNEKNGYSNSQVYDITGLNIDLSEFSGKIDMVKSSTISGSVSIQDAVTNRATLEKSDGMSFELVVSYIDFSFERVEANIDYKLDEIKKVIDLSGIPEFLRGSNVCLDINNPHIVVDVETNVGVPVIGSLNLVPYKGGYPVEDAALKVGLPLPSASSSDQSAVKRFVIGNNSTASGKGDTFVKANISDLIKLVPDSIVVAVEAQTDAAVSSIFEMEADYYVDMAYDMVIPLSFGPDFQIALSDTIDVSDAGIEEILRWNRINLVGSITNSFPLGFDVQVDLLDAASNIIPVEANRQIIASCSSDGSAKQTPLNLMMGIKENAAANGLSGVKVTFVVSSKESSDIPVTDKSYIKAKLGINLPDGITIGSNK
jgi:hypothetical protein